MLAWLIFSRVLTFPFLKILDTSLDTWHESAQDDDTYDDSSIFSGESRGSLNTSSGHGDRLPSSPSTTGNMVDHSDDDEDIDLRRRWGNDGVIVGGGGGNDAKQGHQVSRVAVAAELYSLCSCTMGDDFNPPPGCKTNKSRE